MKIVIADDHPQIRASLRRVLELKEGIEVVGEAANGAEAVDVVERLGPDVVVMDLNMPVMDGIEATALISEQHPSVRVVAFTSVTDGGVLADALKAGAAGYILKGDPPEDFVDALRRAARGERVQSPPHLDE